MAPLPVIFPPLLFVLPHIREEFLSESFEEQLEDFGGALVINSWVSFVVLILCIVFRRKRYSVRVGVAAAIVMGLDHLGIRCIERALSLR